MASFLLCDAWSQPYSITTVAGATRLLDGSNATTVPLRSPGSVAVDAAGNLYIADITDNRVRKVDAAGVIHTFAGTGVPSYNGDRMQAAGAELNGPFEVVIDTHGNVYVVDGGNFRIRIITPDGTINTVAGNGSPGFLGDNGPALEAKITPVAMTVDPQGNLYIATADSRIRRVDSKGIITTIAGNGTSGYSGDNGPAIDAEISFVSALAVDSKGNLYIADTNNLLVRKIDTAGVIHPFAGAGTFGLVSDYVPAAQALMVPVGIALDDSESNLYIADDFLDVVRVVDLTSGLIHTIAGNGTVGFGGDNGPALNAEFNGPAGLAVDTSGDIFVADFVNQRIRKIANNKVTTVAGTSNGDGGAATAAFLNYPEGLAADGSGNVLVADAGNSVARRFGVGGSINTFGQLKAAPHGVAVDKAGNFYVTDDEPLVLKITPAGITSIVAGNSQVGYSGDKGPATSASISSPTGIALDAAGNVYFTDFQNNRIRKVNISTGIIDTIAGNGDFRFSGDNRPALSAGMDPYDIAIDSQSNLYVADQLNNRVRKISPTGIITTVAGTGVAGYAGDGGPAAAAMLTFPSGVAVDSAGNLYIADAGNAVVRRVNTSGLITTIAGDGTPFPNAGDGGPAWLAQIAPLKVAVDGAGDVYVTDSVNDRVRKLTPMALSPVAMTIVSGDKQSATVGTQLTAPLVAKVADSMGTGVPGVVVNFTVNPSGAATVSPSPAITLNDGTVSASVTLGSASGTISVTASAAGTANVSFSVTATPAVSPTAPVISPAGIVGGGLSNPPVMTVASNGIATIFGDKLAPPGTAHQVSGQDLVNGMIPTNLAGTCAVFGPERAPILAVYPGQLNVQVPQLPPGPVTVQVITKCDTPEAETSNHATVTMQAAAPEFFYFLHNGSGHNPIAAINAVTHGYVGAPGLVAGSTFTPAQRGNLLTLFATGFGITNPAFNPGQLPNGPAQVPGPVSVKFGPVTLASADILYVGVTQDAGVYQVNLRVPDGVPDGDQPVIITIGSASSPQGGFITVQGAAPSH